MENIRTIITQPSLPVVKRNVTEKQRERGREKGRPPGRHK